MSPHTSDDSLPSLTVIIPARNEEQSLASAIESVLEQDYEGPLDIVVAIAPSTDRTSAAAKKIASETDRVTIVDNPAGITPTGLNAAIAAASGDIIVRCDAHSELPPNYVSQAVSTLRFTGAVNVGGVQKATGITPIQRAVATAMSSPFGVGDARFHMGGSPGFVDTVYLGVFRRDALEAVGGFDDSLTRNQDYELNYRLREAGGGVYFDPSLEVTYRPRTSLRALWSQYFGYGRWKRVVIRLHPRSARWRQFVAPLFVVGLVGSGVAAVFGLSLVASVVPGAWIVASLGITLYELVKRRDSAMFALPAVFATMHVAWGIGFLLPAQRSARDA